MPTWAACPRSEPASVRGAGFTLLELVIVLGLIGLATAIAVPAVLRTVESWQWRGELERLQDAIRGLPAQARQRGADIVVDEASIAAGAVLPPPEGASLRVPRPWTIHANGVCEAGVVELVRGQRLGRIAVAAPFCEPSPAAP